MVDTREEHDEALDGVPIDNNISNNVAEIETTFSKKTSLERASYFSENVLFAPVSRRCKWLDTFDLFVYSDWTTHRYSSSFCSLIGTCIALAIYILMVRGYLSRFYHGDYDTQREFSPRLPENTHKLPTLRFTMKRGHDPVVNDSYYYITHAARKYRCCGPHGEILEKSKVPVSAELCEHEGQFGTHCYTSDEAEPFQLRGEYGTAPYYSFFQIAVMECDSSQGLQSGASCASATEKQEFWQKDVEFQLCILDAENSASPYRCPVWIPIPGPNWMLRMEVYFQLHIVKSKSQWDLFEFGWGSSEMSYLAYSRSMPKLKSQAHKLSSDEAKDLDLAKFYIRLDDVITTEKRLQVTLIDVLNGAGASWVIVMLTFSIIFKHIFNRYVAPYVKQRKRRESINDPSLREEMRIRQQQTVDNRLEQLEKEMISLLRERRRATSQAEDEPLKDLSIEDEPAKGLAFQSVEVEAANLSVLADVESAREPQCEELIGSTSL